MTQFLQRQPEEEVKMLLKSKLVIVINVLLQVEVEEWTGGERNAEGSQNPNPARRLRLV